jgi:hypothetical protein
MDVLMTLHNAAAADDVVNIRRLVEGADVNVAGDGGWRPLHEAAAEGHSALLNRRRIWAPRRERWCTRCGSCHWP